MKNKSNQQPTPHGWGAAEILRTMREDEQRYRRPRRDVSKRDSSPGKKEETGKEGGGKGP